MVSYLLLLLAVVAAGYGCGIWALRRLRPVRAGEGAPPDPAQAPDPDAGTERLSDTIGFVGGAYGILLGLLLVFAVGHFVDARQVSKDEAATSAALFAAVDPYPAEQRDALRHDLVCFMQSVASDDWAAARAGNMAGAPTTDAYAASVQKQIEALPQTEDIEASNHYFVTEEFLDLAKYRQLRLLSAVPEIPLAIWVVVYLSAFLFVGLTVFHLGRRRGLRRLAVGVTTVLLVAMIAALIQLDAPYKGLGTSLRPVAMTAAIDRLRAANPDPASLWAPCTPPKAG